MCSNDSLSKIDLLCIIVVRCALDFKYIYYESGMMLMYHLSITIWLIFFLYSPTFCLPLILPYCLFLYGFSGNCLFYLHRRTIHIGKLSIMKYSPDYWNRQKKKRDSKWTTIWYSEYQPKKRKICIPVQSFRELILNWLTVEKKKHI